MKGILILAIVTAGFLVPVTGAIAEQKYNPYTNRWETTTNDTILKYNPYENDWSYQKPNAQPEYNPYENKWEFNEKEHNNPWNNNKEKNKYGW